MKPNISNTYLVPIQRYHFISNHKYDRYRSFRSIKKARDSPKTTFNKFVNVVENNTKLYKLWDKKSRSWNSSDQYAFEIKLNTNTTNKIHSVCLFKDYVYSDNL